MGLTPTKTRSKKPAAVAQTDFKVVDRLRREWIASCPIDTDDHQWAQGVVLASNVAGCARQFMEWTHFQPDVWTPPSWYSERLTRMVAWLQAQPRTELADRREDALAILLAAWPQHLAHLQDNTLIYDTIPSLFTPEDFDEFGPLDMPLPYLPHWRVQPGQELEAEVLARRQEAARIGEEFTLYSGLLTHINRVIGLELLDLEPNVF